MKSLITLLLISFSLSAVSYADNHSNPSIQELSKEVAKHLSGTYADSKGEVIRVQTRAGLSTLNEGVARVVLQDAYEVKPQNSSDSLDSLDQYINHANAFSLNASPVFTRSICCPCGECTN